MFAENSSLSMKLPNFRNETLQSYFSLVDFRFSTSTLSLHLSLSLPSLSRSGRSVEKKVEREIGRLDLLTSLVINIDAIYNHSRDVVWDRMG